MNERQFKEFDLNERMNIINLNGVFVAQRSYYNHSINLYTVYGFFVEVWYANFENRITKIQIVQRLLVEKYYLDKIDISNIL
ncbi:MAG: hypothetical protein A3K10_15685 [Bacteroidetes bacterium RIFCSPLOWO2_12_FULL_31_6]|nr:MAG: hypothetical protein A3K10_15685 [Bacteroidetes bacterium RIFCSPLOWO2_12_FULL_31_6]